MPKRSANCAMQTVNSASFWTVIFWLNFKDIVLEICKPWELTELGSIVSTIQINHNVTVLCYAKEESVWAEKICRREAHNKDSVNTTVMNLWIGSFRQQRFLLIECTYWHHHCDSPVGLVTVSDFDASFYEADHILILLEWKHISSMNL